MDKQDILSLKKRYLIWLYKQAKDSLDKIERKFTQLEVDRFMLKELKKQDKKSSIDAFMEEFKAYILQKEKKGNSLKYKESKLNPEYLFLLSKLKAIEAAIIKKLGKPELKRIKKAYEEEMIKRILGEREQKV